MSIDIEAYTQGGRGRVLRYVGDREVQRPFLGLKFWVYKFGLICNSPSLINLNIPLGFICLHGMVCHTGMVTLAFACSCDH